MNWYLTTLALLALLQFSATPLTPVAPALLSWHREGTGTSSTEFVNLKKSSSHEKAPVRMLNDSLGPVLTSEAALMIDPVSKAVLWEKDADEVRAIASITKLMSVIVALETHIDLTTVVTITQDDYSDFGYNNFVVGEEVKAADLLAATLIASDNTAVTALARATGLPHESFVSSMNQKARGLGLTHTRFADPTGLSNENISTAREVLVFAAHAFAVPDVAALVRRRTYDLTSVSGTAHELKTTDQLIGGILTVIAGKTGYVTDSGYNIVAQVTRAAEHPVLGVVLGSATNPDRFQDFKMLSFWVWDNFTWQ
ncbi:MAG: D-alanyl-D-alanine carboxypeptidase [Candidatus Komeilibacteria bacterium]|nr:D-alanyl-D-alanine carboxypeptidase [Candidatus Komeilibacteria bacterium]